MGHGSYEYFIFCFMKLILSCSLFLIVSLKMYFKPKGLNFICLFRNMSFPVIQFDFILSLVITAECEILQW